MANILLMLLVLAADSFIAFHFPKYLPFRPGRSSAEGRINQLSIHFSSHGNFLPEGFYPKVYHHLPFSTTVNLIGRKSHGPHKARFACREGTLFYSNRGGNQLRDAGNHIVCLCLLDLDECASTFGRTLEQWLDRP